MKKVINPGAIKKDYNFKCECCGCEFVVTLPEDDFGYVKDVTKIGFFHKKIITERWESSHCPECQNRCENYYSEVKEL